MHLFSAFLALQGFSSRAKKTNRLATSRADYFRFFYSVYEVIDYERLDIFHQVVRSGWTDPFLLVRTRRLVQPNRCALARGVPRLQASFSYPEVHALVG